MKSKLFEGISKDKVEAEINEWLKKEKVQVKNSSTAVREITVERTRMEGGKRKKIKKKALVVVITVFY